MYLILMAITRLTTMLAKQRSISTSTTSASSIASNGTLSLALSHKNVGRTRDEYWESTFHFVLGSEKCLYSTFTTTVHNDLLLLDNWCLPHQPIWDIVACSFTKECGRTRGRRDGNFLSRLCSGRKSVTTALLLLPSMMISFQWIISRATSNKIRRY